MKSFPPLVYFGSDAFSAAVLTELLKDEYFKSNLKYVVTKTPRISGRGLTKRVTDVEAVATTCEHVTLLHADTKHELDEILQQHVSKHTPLMGVLVSYGVILSARTLSMFDHGVLNFHPSDLPRFRGPSPVESAMLAGERTIGVCIMKLVEAMDAGPIYARGSLEVDDTAERPEVYQNIVATGAPLLLATIKALAETPELPAEPQDEAGATYTRKITKADGTLLPEHKTAIELAREVRTFLGFPKSRVTIHGHTVIVTKAHVSSNPQNETIALACKDDTYLGVDEVVAPSGRTMSAADFVRGYAA